MFSRRCSHYQERAPATCQEPELLPHVRSLGSCTCTHPLQTGKKQIVKFQKISIPTPRKVNGNSKGEGGFKSPIFERKYDNKMEFPEGWGRGSI